MVSQQRSFHLIECPTGVSGPHTRLIVSGRGVPHEALTAFYEALQQTSSAPTIHTLLHPVLSFFSFLEQQEQDGRVPECADAPSSPCLSGMGSGQFPPRTFWAGPPSKIQAAIRAYLLMQWGCRTRRKGLCEELLLAPLTKEAAQIHRFLSALRAFYHFAIARHDYCYHGNPVAAFRLPLRARLWQAIAPLSLLLRSLHALHQSRGAEGRKNDLFCGARSTTFSSLVSREEQRQGSTSFLHRSSRVETVDFPRRIQQVT